MSATQSWQKTRTADFIANCGPTVGVVTACGELDAANADQLADYAQRCVMHCRWLTLDLRGLEFIGTAGFSALHRINVMCSAAGVHWALMPSRAVSRLLGICDPDGAVPVMEPTVESKDAANDREPRLLQLVTQSS
ncbi:hypothetical protein MSIMFI_01959 [Mycobacterium simulans]|uniref:STAS domain-containing protein n=1 Tax=Mycobacterium simulans TaxID=627089 RepID=UPI00174C3295|nr:STAS domain-containing protein [Mycobacterium simulans]SON60464.1 hypothetical protein MSIMFI_01959 [Mycobacterium simulans]